MSEFGTIAPMEKQKLDRSRLRAEKLPIRSAARDYVSVRRNAHSLPSEEKAMIATVVNAKSSSGVHAVGRLDSTPKGSQDSRTGLKRKARSASTAVKRRVLTVPQSSKRVIHNAWHNPRHPGTSDVISWTRAKRLWRRYDLRFGWAWRAASGLMAVVILISILSAIPPLARLIMASPYKLDPMSLQLVGKPDSALASKLTYDANKQQYQFNTDGLKQTPAHGTPSAALLKAQTGSKDKSKESLYALDLPQDFSKGVTYHDTNTTLSFSLVPQFASLRGEKQQEHLVYPLDGGGQAVYTLKGNGLQEDLVLSKSSTNHRTFNYNLNLPNTLAARIIPETGDVGIYSADPTLYGNITYGSDADQDRIMKSRVASPKDHLVFGLPAPVIRDAKGAVKKAGAHFVLKGNSLSVVADGLSSIKGAFTIDPSVVVTSTSDFATNGNNEANISFPSNQINRANLTGATVGGGWSNADTTAGMLHCKTLLATSGCSRAGATAYNGYLYTMGGDQLDGLGQKNVQFAVINANGTLGAWTTTTAFSTGKRGLTAVAYNGYMYAVGGNSGGTYYNDVLYAVINADGTLGSWLTTTGFNVARGDHGGFAYNGYMYVLGGRHSTSDTSCSPSASVYCSDVQYAPINANGTVGAWTTTTSFTNPRSAFGAQVYNGYAYIMGGSDATVAYADVQYAPINADGTTGTWVTSANNIGTNRTMLGSAVYNGYLYITGGQTFSGARNGSVKFAPLLADGSVGIWNSTSTFTLYGNSCTAVDGKDHNTVAYNGYLYIMGGYAGTTCGAAIRGVSYAQIDPAGTVVAYTKSGNSFNTAATDTQEVAYNGYLYVLGGAAAGAPTNLIRYTLIGSDGSVGVWSTTTGFTTSRTLFAAVAYNGYMYVIGGCTSAVASCTTATNNIATVYKAPINTNGTISAASWSAQTAITTARYGHSAVVYNGYMYVLGGLNGSTFQNDVQYQAFGASGTLTGTWTTAGGTYNIPTARASFGAAVYGGVLYIAGGCSAGNLTTCTGVLSDTQYAPLSSSGGLTAAWTVGASFTSARYGLGLVAMKGFLYLTGGYDGTTYYADLQYSPISPVAANNGSNGTWVTNVASALETARYGIGMASWNGYIYVSGGYAGAALYYNSEFYALVNNGGQASLGSWTTNATSFTTARDSAMTVAYNGYIYEMGGASQTPTNLSDIQFASINTDGSVGTWQTTNNLPAAICGGSAVAYKGYMYIVEGVTATSIGGATSCSTGGGHGNTSTYYAPINNNGTITASWTATTMQPDSFGNGTDYGQAVAYNGYLYSLDGNWCSNFCESKKTQYAKINTDGSLGAWTAGTDLPVALEFSSAVAVNGYVYVIGGLSASVDVQTAYYAPLDPSTGAIGAWATTTSINMATAGTVATYNGFIYIVEGGTASGAIASAAINANGTLGNWMYTTGNYTNPTATYGSGVAYKGRFYLLGGNTGSTALSTVQYASMASVQRIAQYSKLINLGTSASLQSITYNGYVPNSNGVSKVNYRRAGYNAAFNESNSTSSLNVAAANCAVGAVGGIQYVWLGITLDDSYDAVFPDASGPNANLTDITVNYQNFKSHPLPSIRLRAGGYFGSGSLQQLDTCGTVF